MEIVSIFTKITTLIDRVLLHDEPEIDVLDDS